MGAVFSRTYFEQIMPMDGKNFHQPPAATAVRCDPAVLLQRIKDANPGIDPEVLGRALIDALITLGCPRPSPPGVTRAIAVDIDPAVAAGHLSATAYLLFAAGSSVHHLYAVRKWWNPLHHAFA